MLSLVNLEGNRGNKVGGQREILEEVTSLA